MSRPHSSRKPKRNFKHQKDGKPRKPMTEQTYRFRRVLGEIMKYLKTVPHKSDFESCKDQYEEQLTEIMQRGFTWGYEYPIPVHDTDFKSLQKKEWAAIRAIIRKQEYVGGNPSY